MSKATKGTSTLFPQVSRGESNDAAKGLLDDAGDSSGDEAHYAPRGDYAPPRLVTTQPSAELNQNCIVGGEEVSFVEISPDRPRLRASASSGDAPPRRPIASHCVEINAIEQQTQLRGHHRVDGVGPEI